MRMKGESADELAGAARAMRQRARSFACPVGAVDTCGTGGDGSGSINVSTLAAIAVAACGVPVAKHGNRALSSRAGSADLLEALGVKIDADTAVLERCLHEVRIAFLFAPAFHAATRHAAGPRKELGVRTLFNLLGPMTNPAGVRHQVVGVFDPAYCEVLARALGTLGSRRVFVVHGQGGIDEIAVAGPTLAWEWRAGTATRSELWPGRFGLSESDPAGLRGGSPADNAEAARAVLAGQAGAARHAVVMEAALALVAAEAEADLEAAARRVESVIDRGVASATLERWAALSQG
jgi:anthranilate phosphoribosyltransferase